MWSKKIRKIVDLSVLGVFSLGVLGIGGGKVLKDLSEYNEYSDAYDAEKQAALDAMRDEYGHIPTKVKMVKPTETTVGYTSGTKCVECGEFYLGHKEIPMLTEKDYNRVVTGQTDSSITISWNLKDEHVAELGQLKYSFTHTKGFVRISKVVGGTSNYLDVEFNKAFPGIEMSYDETTNTITLNVTKEGGITLDGLKSFKINAEGTTLRTTGYPLTIITDGGSDGFNLESNSCDLIVENDLDIHVKDRANISGSYTGVLARKITVKNTGCLRCSNFKYGIFTREDIEVEGCLDVSGVTSAVYYASGTNGGKFVNVAANHDLYIGEKKQTLTDSHLSEQNCGKHVAVCPSSTDVKDFVTYKLVSITKTPTEEAAGEAKFICAGGCSETVKTITLPKLSVSDYAVIETPTEIDGELKSINCYEYHFTNIHTDNLVFDLRENLKSYFTVGDSYMTIKGWNSKYQKAQASFDDQNNVFTITLTGDTTFDLTSANKGGINFSCYDKVKIVGSGTLKITTNQKSGITAKKLEIGENVVLNLDGTNAVKSVYGEKDRDGDFVAIYAPNSLVIDGKANITNFYVGILTNGTCDVNATSVITMKKTIFGIYSNAELVFTSKGNITFSNTTKITGTSSGSGSSVGILTYRAKNTFHFTGNSITTIDADNKGISTYDTNASTNVTIRVSGSASLKVHAYNTNTNNYTVSNMNHFIVENENGTQCDATVQFIANSASALTFLSNTSLDHSFIVNSTKEVSFYKDGNKVSQDGIAFNGGKYDFKILSDVTIKRFGNAMSFTNASKKSAVCDHKIITNLTGFECTNNFKGSVSGVTLSDWIHL